MGYPSHQSEPTPRRTSSAFIINTEIGAVLSVMRRNIRWGIQYMEEEDQIEHTLIKSFKETRKELFSWQTQWHTINPLLYLHPFLSVIQSDETSAPITGVALSSIYKFITLEVLHLNTVNVADSLHKIIDAVTSCRFGVTDPASEEVVLVKILQVLLACMKHKASVKLSNQHVCNMVNTCFQIVHQANSKGELLQRIARQTMHDLVRCIFSHLPDVDTQQENGYISLKTEPYGVPCMVEIFQFLCSLLTAVETTGVGPGHRSNSLSYDEDVPLFSLGLINSVIELGGACLGQHPELLTLLENNLFHSLIQFGMSPSPLILSTVCSIVLNLYHLLRAKLKLQLEAFFSSVLMRIAQNKDGAKYHQQEVAMETIVDLCRQPMFIYEMYTNYDCDISCTNIFEDLVNLLSKTAFPVNTPLTAIHVLALEGLIVMTSSISEKITSNCESQELITSPDLENNPFWNLKCENYENSSFWVPYIRKTKHVKKKLSIGADHFNSDPKKGLEFVQGMRMLPDVLDPVSVACFLRYTTGLDKTLVGDYLGNHDRFHVDVLLQFAKTFDFRDMNLDTALRVFLEIFRLPGESQKIQRFVEAFADQFYEQSPDIFANKDAALLLSYSLILLNTDRHSPQVKRKMSEEDFIRNNRRINGGNDLPREYLSELYGSICENEIRMTPAQGAGVMTHDNWVGLIHKSRQTVPYIVPESVEQINNEMFVILSGPTLAALSVVLDLVEQDAVWQICIDGFLKVAKIAGCYQLDDVIDGLLVALSKFTNLLTPVMSVEDAVFEFGNNSKSMSATIAVFTIANAYGDYIRSGWRNTVDCILTLHKLGLLPTRLNQIEDPEIPVSLSPPPPAVLAVSHSRKSSGLMGRFNDFLYYDTEKPAPQPSQEHLEAQNRAIETVKTSHVNNIFTESKFLQSDSLLNLLQALTGKNKDEEASVFCLELLITVTLNNRDRIMLLWEKVFGYISSIVQSAVMPSKLVEKAVSGLLQICQRLLPYKENLTDGLLKSLQLILKLDARVADAYCEHITQEIMKLVKANARQIKSHVGWRTITSLLSITASHPEASDPGFETLSFIMSDGTHLLPANFVLCVNAARQFSESRVGDTARGIKSLDLMSGSVKCLVKWSEEEGEAADKVYQDIGEMWLRLLQSIRNVCLDPREEIRNHSILTLQYCLTLDGIHIQDELWAQCFESVIFTLVTELLEIAQDKSLKEYLNMEGTVILSVKVLVKVFLHSLASVSRLDSFRKVWVGVLSCFERFMKVKIRGKISDKVSEIVVEVLKESLVVMKLVVGSDDSFWELTWLHVKNIAPDLQSEIFP